MMAVSEGINSEGMKGSENESKDKIAEMVSELKEKRDKYADEIEGVLSYKQNSSNFRYKTNTLLTNLVLDEIYRERNYLLQAIRFIVENKFFDEAEAKKELVQSVPAIFQPIADQAIVEEI